MPGLSGAVRGSVQREVAQMLAKVSRAAAAVVEHGLSPQAALTEVGRQVAAAGGSWKRLLQADARAAAAGAPGAAAGPADAPAAGLARKLQLAGDGDAGESGPASPRIRAGPATV